MPELTAAPDHTRAAVGHGARQIPSSRNHAAWIPVAPEVHYLTTLFVNLFLVGDRDRDRGWTLVDAGLPGTFPFTLRAIDQLVGRGARPDAIVLTHAHFDHAGSVDALADHWDVPVYAHPLELPYLTGRSDYPPGDPSMGGAIAQMSRVFPHSGFDLGSRARALPEDGTVPGLPEWRWIHTPGHTHGHVSLWRAADRTLIAGDAVATMDLDSWSAIAVERRGVDRPAAPFTTDWNAAHRSVRALAELEPRTIGAGHGIPIAGDRVAPALHRLADRFPIPRHGRYVGQPAIADEQGVRAVPPPADDPLPGRLMGAAAVAGAAYLFARSVRARRRIS